MKKSKSEAFSALPRLQSVPSDGSVAPRSIWLIAEGETPTTAASEARVSPCETRSSRTLRPSSSRTDWSRRPVTPLAFVKPS